MFNKPYMTGKELFSLPKPSSATCWLVTAISSSLATNGLNKKLVTSCKQRL